MKFKLLFTCLALLVVSSHSTFFISEEKSSVSKYSLELSEGGKTFKEEIAIDITKGTETFHVSKTSSDESAGDIIYDFKRQMTMIHMAEDKACYMASSVHETPTPAVLKEALETQTPGTGEDLPTTSVEMQMEVMGLLDDRSVLSDEMADLCANLPGYVVVSRAMNVNDEEAMNPNEMEADVEYDEDLDEVIDEGADDFPEISDLDDIADARERRQIGRRVRRLVCNRACNWVTRRICRRVLRNRRWRRVCHNVRRPICRRVCRWVTRRG